MGWVKYRDTSGAVGNVSTKKCWFQVKVQAQIQIQKSSSSEMGFMGLHVYVRHRLLLTAN